MRPGQKKVSRLLFGWGVIFGINVLALCGIEGYAVSLNDQATISELIWLGYAAQPGPFLFISCGLTAVVCVLSGHFFWQNSGTYELLRKTEEKH